MDHPAPAIGVAGHAPSGDPASVTFDRDALAGLAGALVRGSTGDSEPFALRLRAEQLSLLPGFDRLIALSRNRIEELPHQLEAVRRVLREMRGRALLADEVGLGKTIEAALVMQEYRARGMAGTVLILTPPALVRQWQSELSEKFGEELPLAEKPADWTAAPAVIGSLDTAKQGRHRERILEREWDLVIVDEAHRIRNNETLGWKLVRDLRKRHLLLLTATPVQNDLRELYNLVTLLRPGQLGGYRAFRQRFVDRSDPRRPADPERLRALLSEVMVRNRRSQVGLKLPPRRAVTHSVSLTPGERALYEAIAGLSRGRGLKGQEAVSRLLLLQEACSTPDAAAATLRRLAARDPQVHELAAHAELANECAKARDLARIVRDVGDRVLVFTEYRESQERLRRELDSAGIEAVVFHGGLTRGERYEAVRRFHREARVLVSTESGSEGQNLQFCNVLVNFDLPWNPMRLEQRIGRLHRIGQQREVFVFNLAAAETIESDILDLLTRKIRMFELVVGELDLILGLLADDTSFEHEIARVWLESGSSAGYATGLAVLAERIGEARRRYEGVQEAEELISGLLAPPRAG